jgi:L-asparaginase
LPRRGTFALVIAGGPTLPPSREKREENGKEHPLYDLSVFPHLSELDVEIVEWSRQPTSHYTIRMATDLVELLRKLVEDGVSGIVVSSGTDLLEEVAYLTDLLWVYPQPVVFTGALVQWENLGSDAAVNLYQSFLAATSESVWGLGVVVCMQDQIFSASEVTRDVSHRRDAFAAPGRGPIGEITGEQVLVNRRPTRPTALGESVIPAREVELITASLGSGDRLLACLSQASDLDGLVIAGFGMGNVPPSWLPHLKSLVRREIPLVVTSRCNQGRVVKNRSYEGSAAKLVEMGALDGGALRPQQARLRLAVGLGAGLTGKDLQRYLLEG